MINQITLIGKTSESNPIYTQIQLWRVNEIGPEWLKTVDANRLSGSLDDQIATVKELTGLDEMILFVAVSHGSVPIIWEVKGDDERRVPYDWRRDPLIDPLDRSAVRVLAEQGLLEFFELETAVAEGIPEVEFVRTDVCSACGAEGEVSRYGDRHVGIICQECQTVESWHETRDESEAIHKERQEAAKSRRL